MSSMTYLHIRGTLAENMVYRPRPGHESARPGRRGEGDPAYQLRLLDHAGRELLTVAPQVTLRGCGSADEPRRYRVRGILPLHPDGASYELRRGDVLLYAAEIPATPPAIAAPSCHAGARKPRAGARNTSVNTRWPRSIVRCVTSASRPFISSLPSASHVTGPQPRCRWWK